MKISEFKQDENKRRVFLLAGAGAALAAATYTMFGGPSAMFAASAPNDYAKALPSVAELERQGGGIPIEHYFASDENFKSFLKMSQNVKA